MNKRIHRDSQSSTNIFDNRTLEKDYHTLIPLLEPGMRVLDVGCGTGAISSGIARRVAPKGFVIGLDNTAFFIDSGKETYRHVSNLELVHADLFNYHPKHQFDLVVAARVIQWLSQPREALRKLISFLKPGGHLSILDYNHEALEWKPMPPVSMRMFYRGFLNWREDAGMDNRIADNLAVHFAELGFHDIEVFNSDEHYRRRDENFIDRVGIWSKVAGLKQVADEGYVTEAIRLKAIEEYDAWVKTEAEEMTMKLKEVRGRVPD
jgi:SAM-dependent methyltransferase